MTIVHFRAEGLHVVFLGDLGHALTEDELAPIRGADIVLAAAGGPPTIDYPEHPPAARRDRAAARRADALQDAEDQPEHPARRAVPRSACPAWPVERPRGATIEVTPATLPERPTIVLARSVDAGSLQGCRDAARRLASRIGRSRLPIRARAAG